jgi:hypothetical protein
MSNAIDFLASLPGSIADLTAIHPTNGKIKGRSFNVKGNAADRVACETWITDGTTKGFGIYFNVNSLSPRTSWNDPRKAARENVTALNAFHVDADIPKDTAPAEFKTAKSELLRSIRGMNKPPTIIIDSGNGYGLFWVLRKPVKVTAANLDQLTGINIALRNAVPGGADKCQNIDRVMRLPFTTNFPNATKIERGCVVVPTDLISDLRDPLLGEVFYSVEDFEAVAAAPPLAPSAVEPVDIADTVDLSRIAPDFLDLIRNGPKDPKDGGRKIGDGSKSATLFSIGRQLIEAGFEDGEVAAILADPDNKGPAAHIWREGRTRTPEAQAIKTVRDLHAKGVKAKLARTTVAEDFGDADVIDAASFDRMAKWWKDFDAKHGTVEIDGERVRIVKGYGS